MTSITLPLRPKSGGPLCVIALGRISTIHQDVENIEASYRYIQDYLRQIYSGPLDIRLLGEQASGMRTDRATIREAEALIAGGTIDLVIAEDLGRIYRNPRYQFDFVQNAVDAGTRVICIGDNLDTADENWEVTMGAAALRHGLHIPDTRRRVRRTATHAFHNGGMVLKIRFGYRKLTESEALSGEFGPPGLRIAKRPECTPTIREMAARVVRGESYAAVADWLNAEGVAPGPYVTGGRWTPYVAAGLLADPILAGTRTFRDTICQPVYRTGRHKPIVNAEPETKHYPQLAHLSSDEHAALMAAMAVRRGERQSAGADPPIRRGVPRRRTLWPGQSASCAICGGMMYYVGERLRCANSLQRNGSNCWNRVLLPARLLRWRLIHEVAAILENSPSARRPISKELWAIHERAVGKRRNERDSAHELQGLERQAANLTAAIAAGGDLPTLIQRLKNVEASLEQCRTQAAAKPISSVGDFTTPEDAEQRPAELALALVDRSFELADCLRQIISRCLVYPVQAFDTPQIRPRVKLTVDLTRFTRGTEGSANAVVDFTIDAFEAPAHVQAIEACHRLRLEFPQWSRRKIASKLQLNVMTCKRAFDYLDRMHEAGSTDPYRELNHRPAQASRWR